ncbi:MAG: hypothetical protein HY847_10860 [Betaproteobacteria bacterium]|nr:hypothetical protein [Betaproteobacteria bacterium]
MMQAIPSFRWNAALLAATLMLVSACGGGGGSAADDPTATTADTTSTTTTSTTSTTQAAPSLSLTGVAATGVPLLGATVRVVDSIGAPVSFLDASGALANSGTTSPADGAYRLVLATGSPRVPLFIQVAGIDATGAPVVLHSLLQTATLPMVANVTPTTNATVALLLGANPKTVFADAINNASSIALLGNATAVTAASDLVKTIIKTNLTDAKITDSKKLDFFQDAAFAANKSGLDAALEGLRIQIVKSAGGRDLLQFSNKFNLLGVTETSLDLATAKTELSMTTGGSVAKAIVSGKATTSATKSMANLGTLDNLSVDLNKLFAVNAAASDFIASNKIGATYLHNGRDRQYLADKFEGYATNDYQLSKIQVLGCAVNPIPTAGCSKFLISALVMDKSGQHAEVFSDVAVPPASATASWVLAGNGLSADYAVYPAAYASYNFDGSLTTGSSANPGYGVQVVIAPPAGDTTSRIVQIPSGYSIQFAYCNSSTFCVKTLSTVNPVATGELQDMLAQPLTVGALGNLDAAAGAKYQVSLSGSTTLSPVYLPAEVPRELSNAPFPMLNGLAAKPLTKTDITASTGLTLSWEDWAAANPDMHVFLARTLVTSATSFVYSDATLPVVTGTGIKIPKLTIPSGFVPIRYQVWLGAQDSLGRRYFSQFSAVP